MKIVTVWERFNKNTSQWNHNHISDGFNELEIKPSTISDIQKKAWKNAIWRKRKAIWDRGLIK